MDAEAGVETAAAERPPVTLTAAEYDDLIASKTRLDILTGKDFIADIEAMAEEAGKLKDRLSEATLSTILGAVRAYAVAFRIIGLSVNYEKDAAQTAAILARMADALRKARDQFRWYAELHAAKGPGHEDKAKRNADMADLCAAAIGENEKTEKTD